MVLYDTFIKESNDTENIKRYISAKLLSKTHHKSQSTFLYPILAGNLIFLHKSLGMGKVPLLVTYRYIIANHKSQKISFYLVMDF